MPDPQAPEQQLEQPPTPPLSKAISERVFAALKAEAAQTLAPAAEPEPSSPAPQPSAPATPAAARPSTSPTEMPDPLAAATPAPAEPATADEFEPPKGISKAGEANWNKLREARRQEAKARQDAETKYAELEKKIASGDDTSKEVEALRKANDELLNLVAQTNLERDPRFKKYFGEGEKRIIDSATSIGGEHGKAVADVLRMPAGEARDSQLNMLFDNLTPVATARLGALVNDLDKLRSEREAEMSNARERDTFLQTTQKQQRQAALQQAEKDFDSLITAWSDPKTGMAAFQTRDGDAEWNKAVEETRSRAKNIYFGKMDGPSSMRASAWAAAAPQLLAQLNAKNSENEALKAEVAQLKAAQPTLDGGGGSSPAADEVDKNENLSQRIVRISKERGAFPLAMR